MKMFYSPSKAAMYNDAVHGKTIPADAVQVPPERIDEILIGLGLQKTLIVNEARELVLVDPVPVQSTPEQLADAERWWRDVELASLIGLRDRHRDQLEIAVPTTLSTEQFTELLFHIQALRDWPQSPNFPHREDRPLAPEWVGDHVQRQPRRKL